ncbi:MAG TPA: O-antigen ligase family protein [Gemmatimonadales bacterium]|jgi:O-antigen ligase
MGGLKAPPGTLFVYLLWFIILCDPQWWISRYVGTWIRQVPTAMFAVMLLLLFVKPPKVVFPPLLAFIAYTILIIPFAFNRGYTFIVVKLLIVYYVLALATMANVANAKQAVPIICGALFWQNIWWVVLGAKSGLVKWHPTLANYDGYGPLMDVSLGSTYYFALATTHKRTRTIAFLTAMGCCVGLVSSYARGAVLAGGAVVLWILIRSKRKGVAIASAAAVAIVVIVSGLFFTGSNRGDANSNFFTEMSTIGSGDGTQQDREVLWALARRVWSEHPVFGVGAENFGPYAAEHFSVGTVGGAYDENPERLYDKKLHSTYFQLLCEYGVVGCVIFFWMLYDFAKRNAQLRKKAAIQRWAEVSGGQLDLTNLSFSVEAGMVGFLASAFFYNQIFNVHWFYTLVTVNMLLYYLSRPAPAVRRRSVPLPT